MSWCTCSRSAGEGAARQRGSHEGGRGGVVVRVRARPTCGKSRGPSFEQKMRPRPYPLARAPARGPGRSRRWRAT
eukprot:4919511-Prymnesium_polylepis.2